MRLAFDPEPARGAAAVRPAGVGSPSGSMPTDESHPLAESNHQINSLVDRPIQSLGTKRWIRSTRERRADAARGASRATLRGLVLRGLALLLVALVAAPGAAVAKSTLGSYVQPVYNKKVYFPGTGNYYELVEGPRVFGRPAMRWSAARTAARQRTYKGVRGRLAVVKDPRLHAFLFEQLRPAGIIWIGLRYWCGVNRAQWVTGEFHERGEFAPWHHVWNRAGAFNSSGRVQYCRQTSPYWPVHYWGIAHGFRWNANGHDKAGTAYLVEYPTGKK